jgi:hypothetical protein
VRRATESLQQRGDVLLAQPLAPAVNDERSKGASWRNTTLEVRVFHPSVAQLLVGEIAPPRDDFLIGGKPAYMSEG